MADLNYSDMQRAVQDGVRNMQNDIQRVSNNLSTVTQQVGRIDEMESLIRDLQRTIQTLQNTMSGMRSGTSQQVVDPRLAHIANEVHELRVRFAVIEKFAAQMSEYVQARHDEDQEDRQYRAA